MPYGYKDEHDTVLNLRGFQQVRIVGAEADKGTDDYRAIRSLQLRCKNNAGMMGSQGHRRGPLCKDSVASGVYLRGDYRNADFNRR